MGTRNILQNNFCYVTQVKDLREVGPPPNTKRRQNSLNRLCSVCAGLCCKKIVCAALFF